MKSNSTRDKQQQDQQTEKKLPAGQEQTGYVRPPAPEPDPIDEAAAESFPASDPPTYTGTSATPSKPCEPGDCDADESKPESP